LAAICSEFLSDIVKPVLVAGFFLSGV